MTEQGKRWLAALLAMALLLAAAVSCASPPEKASEPAQAPAASPQIREESGRQAAARPEESGQPAELKTPAPKQALSSPADAEQQAEKEEPAAASAISAAPVSEQPRQNQPDEQGAAEASAPPAANDERPPKQNAVTVSIVGDQEKGTILESASVEWSEGDTVLDVLKRITRSNKIQLEYRGKGTAAYVEGIDNLYEFDRGAKSGWVYRVNGEFPNKSAGAFVLKAGDKVEWLYTLDLGKDVGAEVK